MKMCNKVLAVILTLVMLLSAVPLAAFASDASSGGAASAPTGGSSGGSSSIPSTPITLAIPTGTGADGTITVEIDAREIVAALKNDRSVDALIELIKDAIDRSEGDIVTLDEILELVPVSAIISALLGENNENAPALIEQFGGLDELLKLLDKDELILSADKGELVDFVLSMEDPFDLVYIDNILDLDIDWDLQSAYDYADRAELEARIKALTYADLLALVGGQAKNLKKIVNYDALLDALLDADKIDLDEAVDFERLEQDEDVKKAIMQAIHDNYKEILTDEGIKKIEEDLLEHTNEVLTDRPLTENDFKAGTITKLLRELGGANVINYLNVNAILNNPILREDAEEALEAMLEGLSLEEKKALLTVDAQNRIEADPDTTLTVDDLTSSVKNEIIEQVFHDYEDELTDLFDEYIYKSAFLDRYENHIANLFENDAMLWLVDKRATTYVKESTVDEIFVAYADGLTFGFFDVDVDFKVGKLHDVVLDAAEANGFDVLDYLKEGYDPFAIEGVTAIIMQHINWNEVDNPNTIDRKEMLEALLGTDGSVFDLIPEENLRAYLEENDALDTVFGMIENGDVALETIVNVDALLNAIPSARYGELIDLFDRGVLVSQLTPHAKTLAAKLTKEQLKLALTPVLSSLLQNIDLISIDGYEIGKEDAEGLLTFDSDAAVQMLLSKIPSLEDLSEEEAPILSFNIYIAYKTVSGEDRVKDVNFALTFCGDLDIIRTFVNKIKQYISVEKVGNQLYVEVLVPYAITKAYAKLLTVEKGAALRNEILAMAGMDGGDLAEALSKLSLDQILGLMRRVDFADLYETVMTISQIEAALERICAKTGLNIKIEDLQDLDVVVDSIANGVPTFDAVCAAIERKTNRDIMAYLEKATTFADRNATIQSYLDKLAGVPYIGSFVNENSLTEILEKFATTEPIEAVSSFISQKVGKDVQAIVLAYDVDEMYQAALDKVATYELQFNRVKNFALNALDPDYTPTGKWDTLVAKLIPDSVLNRFLSTSLSDFYRGEGVFGAGVDNIHIDFASVLNKVLDEALERVDVNDSYVDIIRKAIPEKTLDFGLHVNVRFQNISEIVYRDINGEVFVTTYLPNGSEIDRFVNAPTVEGKTFLYWVDVDGNRVTTLNGDTEVYALYETAGVPDVYYTVTVLEKNGKFEWKTRVPENGYVVLPAIPSAEALGYNDGPYNRYWYVGSVDGESITENKIQNTPVTSDVTYVFEYKQAPRYTVTVQDAEGNYKWTYTVLEGETLAETLNRLGENAPVIPSESEMGLSMGFYDHYTLTWKKNGTAFASGADSLNRVLNAEIKADTIFVFGYDKHNVYTVTLKDVTGAYTWTYQVIQGDSIAQTIARAEGWADVELTAPVIPTPAEKGLPTGDYDRYTLQWFKDGAENPIYSGSNATNSVLGASITANTEYVFDYYKHPTYTVTIKAPEGAEGGKTFTFTVIDGDTLAATLERVGLERPILPTAAEMDYHNGSFDIYWRIDSEAGREISAVSVYGSAISEDTTFIYDYRLRPASEFFTEADGKGIWVDHDMDGNWTIHVQGHTDFHLKLHRVNFVAMIDANSITIESDGIKMALSKAMIQQILENSDEDSVIGLEGDPTSISNNDLKINGFNFAQAISGFDFKLSIDESAFGQNFAEGGMTITVKFANAVEISGAKRTSIYVLTADGPVRLENVTTDIRLGTVTFAAPHFSDFVAINEYYMTSSFGYNQTRAGLNGSSNLDGQWIPAGAQIQILPQLSGDTYGKVIKKIELVDAEGNVLVNVDRIGDTVTMPDASVTMKVTVEDLPFNYYYVIGNNVYTAADVADHLNEIVVPFGYKLATDALGNIEWNGMEDGASVYLTPKFTPITYTLKFEGIENSYTFTVESFADLLLPAVPAVPGKTGAWDMPATLQEIIAKMDAENKWTVSAKYEAKTYTVTFPDKTEEAKCGDEITVSITPAAGQVINSVKFLNLSTNEAKEIVDGKFIMPDADVVILVDAVAVDVTFSVTNTTTGDKEVFTKPYGSVVSFSITVPKTAILTTVPNGDSKLLTFKVNADGSKTLTYSLVVGEITEITYATTPIQANVIAFANGMVTDSSAPASMVESLTFKEFSKLNFDIVEYQFATYTRPESGRSLLWLWILLAIILLILLIAVFYLLAIRGVIGPNFFTRFILWIVGLFFSVCLGISGFVLMLTQGTTKKDEVDFNAYGVNNPNEATEETDEAAENTATEIQNKKFTEAEVDAAPYTVEETEEVAEEATEEVTEDATEEATEEETEKKDNE